MLGKSVLFSSIGEEFVYNSLKKISHPRSLMKQAILLTDPDYIKKAKLRYR